jgi:hypothetical protein
MAQIEFSSQTWLYILFGLLALAGLIYFFWRRVTRSSVVIDVLNCALQIVLGHINDDELPTSFEAYIFANDGDTSGPLQNVSDFEATSDGISKVKFILRGVGAETTIGHVVVKVKAHYASGPPASGERAFDCMGGSGSGSPELVALQRAPTVEQRPTTTAPLKCIVPDPGFIPAPLHVFNRAWHLAYRGACGQVLWDNGADGLSTPRVELAVQELYGAPWRLTFRWRDAIISYTKPAEEWRALAENTFRTVRAIGVPSGEPLPQQLTVYPA